jgi:hypothetical protein
MRMRERRSVNVERMCQDLKTMQRFSVDHVKSIYLLVSWSLKEGGRDQRSCCTCRACRHGRRDPCFRGPCGNDPFSNEFEMESDFDVGEQKRESGGIVGIVVY